MTTIYDIDKLKQTVEKQRIVIEKLLAAIKESMWQQELTNEDSAYDVLEDVLKEVTEEKK